MPYYKQKGCLPCITLILILSVYHVGQFIVMPLTTHALKFFIVHMLNIMMKLSPWQETFLSSFFYFNFHVYSTNWADNKMDLESIICYLVNY